MSLGTSLLTEFDQEMATTRRLLERVPGGKGEWKPHPKSFSCSPPWATVRKNRDTARGLRQQCARSPGGAGVVRDRGLRSAVVARARSDGVVQRAAWRGHLDPYQPSHPSSGTGHRLPAPDRRPASLHLRSHCGRAALSRVDNRHLDGLPPGPKAQAEVGTNKSRRGFRG